MDEIQRWLEASLAADWSETEREDTLNSLTEESDERWLWLGVAVVMSERSAWWYDTLVEHARRSRQPNERGETAQPHRVFVDWCIGVAAGDIKRPRQRGRPKKDFRDEFICMAMEKYHYWGKDGKALLDSEACALVADVAGLDDSVVAKIWRRYRRRQ